MWNSSDIQERLLSTLLTYYHHHHHVWLYLPGKQLKENLDGVTMEFLALAHAAPMVHVYLAVKEAMYRRVPGEKLLGKLIADLLRLVMHTRYCSQKITRKNINGTKEHWWLATWNGLSRRGNASRSSLLCTKTESLQLTRNRVEISMDHKEGYFYDILITRTTNTSADLKLRESTTFRL